MSFCISAHTSELWPSLDNSCNSRLEGGLFHWAKRMTARQQTASAILQSKGYSAEWAAAFVGDFSQEVGINLPSAFRPPAELDHGSQALPQWRDDPHRPEGTKGRLTKFLDWCAEQKLDPGAMAVQLHYVIVEVARDYQQIDRLVRSPYDIDAAVDKVCWIYERPSKQYADLANWRKQAHITFNESEHLAPRSPATQARIDAAKARNEAKKANSHAGVSAILGAIVASAHAFFEMPSNEAIPLYCVIGAAILYAAWCAVSAYNKAIANLVHAKQLPPIPGPLDDPAPTAPPDGAPIPIFVKSLGIWVHGWPKEAPSPKPAPPPPTEPAPQPAPDSSPAVRLFTLRCLRLAALAETIKGSLSAELAADVIASPTLKKG